MPVSSKADKVYLTVKSDKDEGVAIILYDTRNKEKSEHVAYEGSKLKEIGKWKREIKEKDIEWEEFYFVFDDSEDDVDYIFSISAKQFATPGFLNSMCGLKSVFNIAFGPYENEKGYLAFWVKENDEKTEWAVAIEDMPKAEAVELDGGKRAYKFGKVNEFWTNKLREKAEELGITWRDRTISSDQSEPEAKKPSGKHKADPFTSATAKLTLKISEGLTDLDTAKQVFVEVAETLSGDERKEFNVKAKKVASIYKVIIDTPIEKENVGEAIGSSLDALSKSEQEKAALLLETLAEKIGDDLPF